MYGGKKSIEVAGSWKEAYHFGFVLLCIRGQIPSPGPPGGLHLEGRFQTERFLCCDFGGLICGGAYFWNFTVLSLYYLHLFPPLAAVSPVG